MYEPFGNVTVSGAANGNYYQFTGRENDATGLYYYRARYYSPKFQRFISQDPIGFRGGETNLYGYAYGNPISVIDSFGYRARYYSATYQRFVAQDPIGFGSGSANLYAYSSNNPLRFRDPYGKQVDNPFDNPAEDPMNELLAEGIADLVKAYRESPPPIYLPPGPQCPVHPFDPFNLFPSDLPPPYHQWTPGDPIPLPQ
jgi:RHS repeat-associated protein